MREIVCIVCPNSCVLQMDEAGKITGARCKRGEQFFLTELNAPMRSLTTTVRTAFKNRPVLPVKTDGEVPKHLIFECMREINRAVVKEPVARGETIIKDICGTGVDVIATSDLQQ